MKLPYGSAGKLSSQFPSEGFPEHAKNFAEQVQLYKALAMSSWTDASPDERAKMESAISRFKELKKRLDSEVKDFATEDFSSDESRVDERVASITLFMYLYDKTLELHEAVMKKSKVGLNALFDTTRNSIYSLLSSGFFVRPFDDDVKDYLTDEPLLVACSELADVELVPLDKAVASYQPKLKELVLPLIKEEGSESKTESKAIGETGAGPESKSVAAKGKKPAPAASPKRVRKKAK